jgi:hypothetical protein
LRYEGFEPKSVGIRAILPHVDEFRTIHNLDSMRDLTRVLGAETPRNMESMARWRSAAA